VSAAATISVRTPADGVVDPWSEDIRASWAWLVVSAASRVYIALVISLAAVATVPVLFGWQATVVQSGSMMPHIRPGDVVVTMPLPDDKPVPLGRVVSFRTSAQANADGEAATRLHRIVAVNPDGTFMTQGDANHDADSDALVRSQIIGQARLLVPGIGLPSLWFGTGDALALILWSFASIAAVLIMAFDLPTSTSRHSQSFPRPRPQES
jgi:signal peptidase I